MKFEIQMKTPDALEDAIKRTIAWDLDINLSDSMTQEQIDTFDALVARTKKQCEKWFDHGECVTLEIDTEKDTCTVV